MNQDKHNTEKKPQVSVIIPCYNHGRFIVEAIDSVLAQTFQDFEIIAVNDGSTDPETNIVFSKLDKPKTRVYQTENQGLPAARNFAINHAQGEFILPLDADDKIAPTLLNKAVKILAEDPQIGIVGTYTQTFGAENWTAEPQYSLEKILVGNQLTATSMFRRADWQKVGGYDEKMPAWEDYDFWLKIIELGRKVRIIPEYLFFYRKHPAKTNLQPHSLQTLNANPANELDLWMRIIENHPNLYRDNLPVLVTELYRLKHALHKSNHALEEAMRKLASRSLANLPFLIYCKIKQLFK